MTLTLGHLKHKPILVIWISIINIYLSIVFIFSHFDWICCNRTQGVCLCVCMCVSSLQPKRMNRFWWNFPQIIWQIFASVIFRGFWNFEFDDVMAAILHFCVAALSRSQFWSDFLQIWTQVSLTHAGVCYWKSARSVDNFRWLREPRFTKNRFFGAKIEIFEIG